MLPPGLGVFLLALACYTSVFARGFRFRAPALLFVVWGAAVLYLYLPHTPAHMRLPVLAYLVNMTGVAIAALGGAHHRTRTAIVGTGAVCFGGLVGRTRGGRRGLTRHDGAGSLFCGE